MGTFVNFIFNNSSIIIGVSAAIVSVCFLTSIMIDFSGMTCCCYQKRMYELKTSVITAIAGTGFFGLGIGEIPDIFYDDFEMGVYNSALFVGFGSILTGFGFVVYGVRGWIRTRANKLKEESEKDYTFSYVGSSALPGLLLLGAASFLDEGLTLAGVGYVALIMGFLLSKVSKIRARGIAFALSGFGIIHLGGDYVFLALNTFRSFLNI